MRLTQSQSWSLLVLCGCSGLVRCNASLLLVLLCMHGSCRCSAVANCIGPKAQRDRIHSPHPPSVWRGIDQRDRWKLSHVAGAATSHPLFTPAAVGRFAAWSDPRVTKDALDEAHAGRHGCGSEGAEVCLCLPVHVHECERGAGGRAALGTSWQSGRIPAAARPPTTTARDDHGQGTHRTARTDTRTEGATPDTQASNAAPCRAKRRVQQRDKQPGRLSLIFRRERALARSVPLC